MNTSQQIKRFAAMMSALWLALFFGVSNTLFAQCVTRPPGLVGWWPGEGNANDIAGANNGTMMYGASFTNGVAGQAFNLPGVSTCSVSSTGPEVLVPDSNLWAFGANNFSIELWAYFNTVTNCLPTPFISNDEGAGENNKWWFALAGGNLDFHINGPTIGVGGIHLIDAPFTPMTNTWYHFAITRNGNVYTIYTNGIAIGSQTATTVIPNPNAPLAIGSAEGYYFNGRLDEVSIYNRALSASEIAAIYNAGSAGKCGSLFPSIYVQPSNQTAISGSNVTFAISAFGHLPLFYQWFFNTTNLLGGQTNSSLTLSNATWDQTGPYSVQVSNSFGFVTSSNAILMVIDSTDTDHDGIPNYWEQLYGLNLNDPTTAMNYPPGDKLTYLEKYLYGLDPTKIDTDGDGLSDYDEIFVFHTNPLLADTDGDGIPDKWEVDHGLNPLVNDAAQIGPAGVSNLQIYQYDHMHTNQVDQLDPHNPFFAPGTSIYEVLNNGQHTNHFYYDHEDRLVGAEYSRGISLAYTYDGNSNLKRQTVLSRANETNGLPVLWLFLNGLTNSANSDSYADSDGDGWSNYQEWLAGSNPNDSNSIPNLLNNPGTNIASLALPFTPSNFVVGVGQLDVATGDEIVVGGDGNPNGTTNSILVLINNGVTWTTQKLNIGNFGVTSIAIGQLLNRPAPAIYAGLRQTGGQGRIREFMLQSGTWITNDIIVSSNEAAFVISVRPNADLLASVSTNGASSPLCSLQFTSNVWSCAVVSTNNSSLGLGASAFLLGNIPRYGAARLLDTGGIEVFNTGLEFLTNRSLLPTNSIYNPAADKWYFASSTIATWNDTEAYCQQNLANLVTIGSAQENQFIHSNYPGVYHIGLQGNQAVYYPAQETWAWVSGSPSNYRNWAPGQPSNNDGIHSATGYGTRKNSNGQWEPEFAYDSNPPQSLGIGEINGNQGRVVVSETPATARLNWRGTSLATRLTRLGQTNGFSLIYICVDDRNLNGKIDNGDDFVLSEYIITTNTITTNTYIRTSIGSVNGQGSYGVATANYLNDGTSIIFTASPDGMLSTWSATNGFSPLTQHLFTDAYKGTGWHALAPVKTTYGGDGLAGLNVNPTNPSLCNVIFWSPQFALSSPQSSLIETAPSAAVLPSNNPLGSNAVVIIRLRDNEGNASTPFLQYQILDSTNWQNATLTSLDGFAYNPATRVTALPTGFNHTLRWNALADLKANMITNVLLRASAQDFMLMGDWSLPTPFQINTSVAINPTNSPVTFIGTTPVQGGFQFNWQGSTNALLYLQRSPALAGTNAVWVNIWTGVPPTLNFGSYTDFFGTNPMEFYRIQIVSP